MASWSRRVALVTLTTSALVGGLLAGATADAAPAPAAGTPAAVAPAVPAVPPGPAVAGSASTRPTEVRTLALPDRAAAQKTGPGGSSTDHVADSGQQRTAGFSLVGVSWDRSSSPSAVFSVRTRTGGRWTSWSTLSTSDVAPDGNRSDARASQRRATEPLWVGASDGVQVRLVSAPRRPTGVRVELVDPGVAPLDAQLAADAGAGTSAGSNLRVAPNAVARRAPGAVPAIIRRSAWGADERLRNVNPNCTKPEYGTTIKAGFVHHTDSTNSYGPGESAAMVRSMYAYHVKSNRWCDLGYNFLVDRFGRLFEGRFGGVDKPVIGAHTGGFNVDTFGVSMIGTFTSVAPPTAMLTTMADLFAWKFGSYYRNPHDRTVLTAAPFDGARYPAGSKVTFNTISGHRDGVQTSCPGNAGYAALPTLRGLTWARLPISAVAIRYHSAPGTVKATLGEPIGSGEQIVRGGLMTRFQRGSLTYSAATGTRMLSAPFTATYLRVGGPGGFLGFPVNRDEAPTANGLGRSARFQRGFIHSSPRTGARETHGAIADRYAALGFEGGVLGYPQIDVTTRPDGVGRYSRFDGGYVFYTPALGGHEVYGVILERWRALGFEAGALGYPRTNPNPTADGAGRYQHFVQGSVFWSPDTGAHEVRGAIRDRYFSMSAERGTLGYPTSDERVVRPGVVQTDFQHGSITWTLATGTTAVALAAAPPTE